MQIYDLKKDRYLPGKLSVDGAADGFLVDSYIFVVVTEVLEVVLVVTRNVIRIRLPA